MKVLTTNVLARAICTWKYCVHTWSTLNEVTLFSQPSTLASTSRSHWAGGGLLAIFFWMACFKATTTIKHSPDTAATHNRQPLTVYVYIPMPRFHYALYATCACQNTVHQLHIIHYITTLADSKTEKTRKITLSFYGHFSTGKRVYGQLQYIIFCLHTCKALLSRFSGSLTKKSWIKVGIYIDMLRAITHSCFRSR